MSSNDKVLKAKALRQTSISQLGLIIDAAKAAKTDESQWNNFKIRYRSLTKIKKDFEKHHNNLIALLAVNPDELKLEEKVGIDFAKRCHEIDTCFYELFELPLEEHGILNTSIQPVLSPFANRNAGTLQNNVILPKIELPIFKGDITSFPTFNQTFCTLIHNNRNLSNIEKFNYLLTSLEGPPLNLISDILVTNDNYLIAYHTIIERYNNKRLQAFNHWKLIEESPRLTSEHVGGLRTLLDTFSKNISALQNLNFDTNAWDFILSYMLLDRLDSSTRKAFEQQHASNEVPKYEAVRIFVQRQCVALESVPQKTQKFSPNQKQPPLQSQPFRRNMNSSQHKNKSALLANHAHNNVKCFLCEENHIIYRCPTFLSKSVQQRFDIVKSQRACINCLATAHTVSSCNSQKRCRSCNKNHHSLLCFQQTGNKSNNSHSEAGLNSPTNNSQIEHCDPLNSTKITTVGMTINDHEVLLSTVLLRIRDAFGEWHTVKAILDSGAQSSFITKACANRLALPKFKVAVSLQGLDSMCTTAKLGMHCVISPIHDENILLDINTIILDKICDDIPAVPFLKENFSFTLNLRLADPNFAERSKVDLLLGNDVFPYILRDGRLFNGPDQPVCVNTVFGWTLMGKTICRSTLNTKVSKSFFSITDFSSLETLNQTLQKFWHTEEVPEVNSRSPDDEYCENYYLQTTTRTDSGRYVVSLPFKVTAPDFGDTFSVALRRYRSLEKRFLQNKAFHLAYCAVIRDFLDNGHMEVASQPSVIDLQNYFYISHHAVFKKDSTTTPIRVVFDASTSASNKISLNNALHTGPKLQKDLVNILLNFRLHKFVFTCDIKQMFRMILVHPNDRVYQRILWRFSPNEPLLHYQINVLTFGVVCSPYLAIRTLLRLAEDYTDLPMASNILKTSTYVDDLTGGGATLTEVNLMKIQIIELLARGGFEARKWASNSPDLLKDLPKDHIVDQNISFDPEGSSILKILGLRWDPVSDNFNYTFSKSTTPVECTKRSMLSELARTYDPLGFLTPLTVFIKILIQLLWSFGLDWDERPSEDVVAKWLRFNSELPLLPKIKINREINIADAIDLDLFGFCDASERAYCGVVYIRTLFADNSYKTYFVCAKSKVSPLKTLSLARLELCAATLLAKLMHYVLDVYSQNIKFKNVFAFTDSSVVLDWIKGSPHRWKTFVSNRVSYVQEKIAPNLWFHVPSEFNPADCGTRGMFLSELVDFSLWWNGPDFLLQNNNDWLLSKPNRNHSTDVSNERKQFTITTFISLNFIDVLLDKYSSLSKIKRIVSYFLRAVNKFKSYNSQEVLNYPSHLTIPELHNALFFLTKYIQSTSFQSEITLLKNNKPLVKSLQKLKPFLDEKGYLRVGGRLSNSNINYSQKFPLLLPSKSNFTTLLIKEIHFIYLHCGVQTTQYLLFQNFWVISAKRIIRQVIHHCHICWRINPKPYQPPMGNLPKFRVSECPKAFSDCGMDMCGPFSITLGKLRGSKIHKAYICLFICCSTKAVHLELVSDLSTEALLAALRRFIARRGKILNLYSDCGTNFVGADKYLRQIYSTSATGEVVNWHFNPPAAPHMGGIWEANIKSVKSHLIRVVGSQILTYEELNTVIIQIEAVLNSRPLCPISTDPSDLSVLTPGHFLSLQPLTVLPDPDITNVKINRLTRWQLLQRMHRDFWMRWHREYLHTLQQRAKWYDPITPVLPGTMVVIKDENLAPLSWPLGRIVEVVSGRDAVPRVAVVRTAKGTLKRPLVKLCPLPLTN